MKIAVFKNDKFRVPYLVHHIVKDCAILGLENYPEIEQDYGVSLDMLEFLKEGTEEYDLAKELIERWSQ